MQGNGRNSVFAIIVTDLRSGLGHSTLIPTWSRHNIIIIIKKIVSITVYLPAGFIINATGDYSFVQCTLESHNY